MPRPETQYALYEFAPASKPNERGIVPTALISASLPLPQWLSGNAVLSGNGIFVVYYSVYFSDTQVSSAMFRNGLEIPATRILGNQNHGYLILSTEGCVKTKLTLHATPTTVLRGKVLIAELSFHDEDSVVE